ncbi:MAG: hypothetical protein ABEJ57_08000 [Halobacteriaceae archaeon]
MVTDGVYILSIAFAMVAGTAAFLLSLLSWEVLRYSPLGRVLFLLAAVQLLFVLYHVFLLLFPDAQFLRHFIHAAMYTAVAVAVWLLVWAQRKVLRGGNREVDPS